MSPPPLALPLTVGLSTQTTDLLWHYFEEFVDDFHADGRRVEGQAGDMWKTQVFGLR